MAKNVTVIGAGSWGTTLALVLNENGHKVTLWEYFEEDAENIIRERENKKFLPGIPVPETMYITSDIQKAVSENDLIVMAVPSHIMRSVAKLLNDVDTLGNSIFVSVAKGIENDTLMLMTDVLKETIQGLKEEQIAVLSGPSHAEEVSQKIPTVVVAASKDLKTAQFIQQLFMNDYFRVYTSSDTIGIQLGGSLKNIIAIAAGICDGVGLGDNTKAALLTRGLSEMSRLASRMGAESLTFAGLAGMGDLIVTCMSRHSRNRHVGEEIGKGKTLQEVLDEMVMVAEGVRTSRSAYDLAKKYQVDMPITSEIYLALFENKNPLDAVRDLMTRDPKIEDWG